MTTVAQDRDFLSTIISRTLLEDAIEWITTNMEPDEVFEEKKLANWADDVGYTKS